MFRSEHPADGWLHPVDPARRDELLVIVSNAAPSITNLAEARSAALRILSLPEIRFQSTESNAAPLSAKKSWDPTLRRQVEILASGKVLATSLVRAGNPDDELRLEHPTDVAAVELLPDGGSTNSMMGVRYANRDVIVWNVELAAMVVRFTNVPPANVVRVSADGSMAVLIRPPTGTVEWKRSTKGQLSLGLLPVPNAVDAVPSPDGQIIATWTSSSSPIQLFRPSDPALIGSIPSTHAQKRLQWSPDGLWIAISGPNGFTSLWNATSLQLVSTFRTPGADSASTAFVPWRHTILTLDSAGTLSWQCLGSHQPDVQMATGAQAFRVQPDGLSLVLFRQGGAVVDRYRIDWNPNWITALQDPPSRVDSRNSLAWDSTGTLLAVASTTGLGLYEMGRGLTARVATENPVTGVNGIRGGNEFWVTTTRGIHALGPGLEGLGKIHWNSKAVHPFPQDALGSSASMDGKVYAVQYADHIAIHAEEKRTLEVRTPVATGQLEITSDGRWLAMAGSNGGVQVLATSSGRTLWTAPDKGRCTIRFSPNGTTLLIGTGQHYRLWSMEDYSLLWTLPRGTQRDWQAAMDFSPDGKWLACAGRVNDVWMVNAVDGKELFRLKLDPAGPLNELRFSPNQLHLCALQPDQIIRVWDLEWIQTQLARLGLGLDRK